MKIKMTMLHLQLLSFLQNQGYKNVSGHFAAELLYFAWKLRFGINSSRLNPAGAFFCLLFFSFVSSAVWILEILAFIWVLVKSRLPVMFVWNNVLNL